MGAFLSFINETFPPETKFTVDDIPQLSGKVIIVTGANTGVGKETARALLQHNAKVYIAARNPEKAGQAIKDLQEDTGKEALYLKLDLGDLTSIKNAAEEFLSKENELHVLFNNAGVMTPPIDQLTAQGYDLQFGTNVLGHFYFTKLLLPALLVGARSSPDGKARVVNTSSFASLLVKGIDLNTLKDSPARRKKSPMTLYMESKLGNIIFSNELARRYGDHGIVSTAVNPGNLTSDLQRHTPAYQRYLMNKLIMFPVPYGSLTQLFVGTAPEGSNFNGQYFIPWARPGVANPAAHDAELGKDLWKWLEEQVENV